MWLIELGFWNLTDLILSYSFSSYDELAILTGIRKEEEGSLISLGRTHTNLAKHFHLKFYARLSWL